MGFVVLIILLHCCLPVSTSYSLPGFPKRYSNTSSNTSDETKPYVIQFMCYFSVFPFSDFDFFFFETRYKEKYNFNLFKTNVQNVCSNNWSKVVFYGNFRTKHPNRIFSSFKRVSYRSNRALNMFAAFQRTPSRTVIPEQFSGTVIP